MVREGKVLLYFNKIIFCLTTTNRNAAKIAKKHTGPPVLATQKAGRPNKISKLSSKEPKSKKRVVKPALFDPKIVETKYVSPLMNLYQMPVSISNNNYANPWDNVVEKLLKYLKALCIKE